MTTRIVNSKKNILKLSCVLPLLAFALSQFFSFSSFASRWNFIAAAMAFVATWIWAHVIGPSLFPSLLFLLFSLVSRVLVVCLLFFGNFSFADKRLAILFLVGYHFVETALVTLGSWRRFFSGHERNEDGRLEKNQA
jgi:hypothetical protein